MYRSSTTHVTKGSNLNTQKLVFKIEPVGQSPWKACWTNTPRLLNPESSPAVSLHCLLAGSLTGHGTWDSFCTSKAEKIEAFKVTKALHLSLRFSLSSCDLDMSFPPVGRRWGRIARWRVARRRVVRWVARWWISWQNQIVPSVKRRTNAATHGQTEKTTAWWRISRRPVCVWWMRRIAITGWWIISWICWWWVMMPCIGIVMWIIPGIGPIRPIRVPVQILIPTPIGIVGTSRWRRASIRIPVGSFTSISVPGFRLTLQLLLMARGTLLGHAKPNPLVGKC